MLTVANEKERGSDFPLVLDFLSSLPEGVIAVHLVDDFVAIGVLNLLPEYLEAFVMLALVEACSEHLVDELHRVIAIEGFACNEGKNSVVVVMPSDGG